jgi:hypothetical protein
MMEMMQAAPQVIPLIGDLWASSRTWPMADKIAERLKADAPAEHPRPAAGHPARGPAADAAGHADDPAASAGERPACKQALKDKGGEIQVKAQANQIHGYEAQTHRMVAMKPPEVRLPPQAA